MPISRKAYVRELTTAAYEINSGVVEGELHREAGQWMVGDVSLDEWMERYEDQEIVLIVASLEEEREMPVKICRTCGTEYSGIECPRCREARLRLRGRR